MVEIFSRAAGPTGSALVRLLARLGDVELREPRQAPADRLSQWHRWSDAIALSTALVGVREPAPVGPTARPASVDAIADALAGLRKTLASGIASGAVARLAVESTGASGATVAGGVDFAPYRRRHLAAQQDMVTGIAPLRIRLRAALTARSAGWARLAAVDAVMEQTLAPHERRLLALVPVLLQQHFARALKADGDGPAALESPAASAEPPRSRAERLDAFCMEQRTVLLAELEIRLQPLEGLLAALRTP